MKTKDRIVVVLCVVCFLAVISLCFFQPENSTLNHSVLGIASSVFLFSVFYANKRKKLAAQEVEVKK